MKRTDEKRLETLSPFEIKNTLIDLAQNTHEKSMIVLVVVTLTGSQQHRVKPSSIRYVCAESQIELFQVWALVVWEFNKILACCSLPKTLLGTKKVFSSWSKLSNSQLTETRPPSRRWYAIDKWNLKVFLGNNYPVPDRMLKYSELIARKCIQARNGRLSAATCWQIWSSICSWKGGTTANDTSSNTLKSNRLLNKGDTIAIGAPIFTPPHRMQGRRLFTKQRKSWQQKNQRGRSLILN